MANDQGTEEKDEMDAWRLVAIKLETGTVLLSGWVAQNGAGGLLEPEWLERLGGLLLAGLALWRLLWHEIPAWRQDLRAEREASSAHQVQMAEAVARVAESVRELSLSEARARAAAIKDLKQAIAASREGAA